MRRVVPFLLLASCSDYGLSEPVAPEDGPPDGDEQVAEPENPGGNTDADSNDPGGPTDPDPFGTTDCADGVIATWSPGEVVILSSDAMASMATLTSPEAGTFHVYDIAPAESGAGQRNETMYMRITNATEPDGYPLFATCDGDYWVPDPDNDGALPTDATQYLGTFWLDAGDNAVSIWHACPRIRAGECIEHHDTTDAAATCESNNVNSVHVTGDALCLVPA